MGDRGRSPSRSVGIDRVALLEVRQQLASTGKVRVAISVGSTANTFRATLNSATSRPGGVAVDLANALGAPVELMMYDNYPDLLDGARRGVWDVTFIGGGDEERAKVMDFGPAYYRTELTYLVPSGSAIYAQADVDRPGVRIAVAEGSATAQNRQEALKARLCSASRHLPRFASSCGPESGCGRREPRNACQSRWPIARCARFGRLLCCRGHRRRATPIRWRCPPESLRGNRPANRSALAVPKNRPPH